MSFAEPLRRQWFGIPRGVAGLDAEQGLVRVSVGGVELVDVAGRCASAITWWTSVVFPEALGAADPNDAEVVGEPHPADRRLRITEHDPDLSRSSFVKTQIVSVRVIEPRI